MVLMKEHSEVLEALDMVLSELDEESSAIFKAGGDQLSKGNVAPAQQAIEYAKRLESMMESVKQLRESWQSYLDDVDKVAPEVKEILRWQNPTAPRPSGGTRTVGEIGPWKGFKAIFSDGTVIHMPTAKETFAAVIQKLGSDRVAKLDILIARQPLVARNRVGYDGPTSSLAELEGGWTVRTDVSTDQKVRYLKAIATSLGESVNFEVLPRRTIDEVEPAPLVKRERFVPTKASVPPIFQGDGWEGGRYVPGVADDMRVSAIVKTWFPILFQKGLVMDEEVAFFLTHDSSKIFKSGGYAVLLPNRGCDSDRYFPINDGTMHARYYDLKTADLKYGEQRFYLCSQFMPQGKGALVKYLNLKGFTTEEIVKHILGSGKMSTLSNALT